MIGSTATARIVACVPLPPPSPSARTNEPRRATDVLVWQPSALGRDLAIDLRRVFRGMCDGGVEGD